MATAAYDLSTAVDRALLTLGDTGNAVFADGELTEFLRQRHIMGPS